MDEVVECPISPRGDHAAVWTGSRMVIWGGSGDGGLGRERPPAGPAADGAAYDPASGTWSAIAPAPLTPRLFQTSVSTGDSMIVWGGSGGDAAADGTAYDPRGDRWTRVAEAPGIEPRARHSAVWTGSTMIVWGGSDLASLRYADSAAFTL